MPQLVVNRSTQAGLDGWLGCGCPSCTESLARWEEANGGEGVATAYMQREAGQSFIFPEPAPEPKKETKAKTNETGFQRRDRIIGEFYDTGSIGDGLTVYCTGDEKNFLIRWSDDINIANIDIEGGVVNLRKSLRLSTRRVHKRFASREGFKLKLVTNLPDLSLERTVSYHKWKKAPDLDDSELVKHDMLGSQNTPDLEVPSMDAISRAQREYINAMQNSGYTVTYRGSVASSMWTED